MVFEFFLSFTRLVMIVMIDIRVRGKGGGFRRKTIFSTNPSLSYCILMCGFTDTLKEVAIILWLDGWILCPSSVLTLGML